MTRRKELENRLSFLIGDCKTREDAIKTLEKVVNTTWNFNAEQSYAFEMGTDNPSFMAKVWASQNDCSELLGIYRKLGEHDGDK